MDGLQLLSSLPDDKKNAIANKFGSIDKLYRKIFELNHEDYLLHTKKPNGYKTRQSEIESELFDIEDGLDEIGVDGHDITTEVSSDHGEIIVSKNINDLDKYLKNFGTDYETMRKWMEDNYGI
jgi:hypothetical protein